ncbi:hypothetical protein [Streptomyces sp. NPDC089799]|uniref:hypothetical protein n=1 Tax=Streptomyces sp. NPDC089799 TaxID=3155066 RepID=UPI00342CFB83
MIRVTRVVTATAAVLALASAAPGPAFAQPTPGPRPDAAGPATGPATGPGGPATETTGRPTAGGLPPGWRITGTGSGRRLVWTADRPVAMGDARIEFRSGDRLLGLPTAEPDGRSFSLDAAALRIGPDDDLRVLSGGRRIDASAPRAPRPEAFRQAAPSEAPMTAAAVDPGTPGGHRTVTGEYTLPSVTLPGLPAPVEMRGTVVGPADAPAGRPLVLFLHGRHGTCYTKSGETSGDWPCKSGWQPIPSQNGYLQAQKLLASQGYVTVSIAANGINGQDDQADDGGAQARSSLVRRHLAQWADWAAKPESAPAAVKATARADLSKVMLVGHSRGGEGVNRAALDSLYRPPADQDGHKGPVTWKIRGNVLIGPTIFGQNPVPDVPSTTLLPGCDGDVSDLQGQIVADGTRGVSAGSALHSSVYMVGANHNYFNTEWTPGQAKAPAQDDFWNDGENPDPVCTPGKGIRLTAAQQQTAGATYIAASARLFVAGDDAVRPLLDGSGHKAPSAGPARVLTHAVGGHRIPLVLPGAGPAVSVTGGRICAQVDPDPKRACLPSGTVGRSPHFAGWEANPEPGRDAVALRWTAPGAAVTVRPAKPVSLAGSRDLTLRLIVPPNSAGTQLDLALTDTSGRRAVLGRTTVDGLPGTDRTASHWAREVRLPLAAATRAGLDLKAVQSLELTPRSRSGQAWLMDAWGWRPGTPAVKDAALPRVDIGRLVVPEGNSGSRTYKVPVKVSGEGTGQVRIFVRTPGREEQITSKVVDVRAGAQTVDVPFTVQGNTRYGYDTAYDVAVKAVRGAVVGSHLGGLTARNDDPVPAMKAVPLATSVTEGSPLVWRVTLSAPADVELSGDLALVPVDRGPELSTADVDPKWLDDNFAAKPDPSVPLSRVREEPVLVAGIPAGKLTADVAVPTSRDRVREPAEKLQARLITYNEKWEQVRGPLLTGTVKDAS